MASPVRVCSASPMQVHVPSHLLLHWHAISRELQLINGKRSSWDMDHFIVGSWILAEGEVGVWLANLAIWLDLKIILNSEKSSPILFFLKLLKYFTVASRYNYFIKTFLKICVIKRFKFTFPFSIISKVYVTMAKLLLGLFFFFS